MRRVDALEAQKGLSEGATDLLDQVAPQPPADQANLPERLADLE